MKVENGIPNQAIGLVSDVVGMFVNGTCCAVPVSMHENGMNMDARQVSIVMKVFIGEWFSSPALCGTMCHAKQISENASFPSGKTKIWHDGVMHG